MFSEYQSDTAVTITVAVPAPGGSTLLTANSVEYAVFDEVGDVVVARGAFGSYTNGDLTVDVAVDGADNALIAGTVRGMRRIDVYFTTDDGTFSATARYMITAVSLLAVMQNSFMTYEEALITASDMFGIDGWSAATEAEQMSALASSYLRLIRMNYRYKTSSDVSKIITGWTDSYEPGSGGVYTIVTDIDELTVEEWQDVLPTDFKRALRRAQIIEANVMLSGDPYGDMRQEGIISETVGESKVFLRSIPPIRTPVSRETMTELRGFIFRRNVLSRA